MERGIGRVFSPESREGMDGVCPERGEGLDEFKFGN